MSIEELDTKQELGRWLLEYLEAEGLPMTAVQGLQSAVTPGKWEPLTLLNGFSNYGGGYSPAAYRTIPGGGVQLRGMVTHATEIAGSIAIADLPVGLAPRERLLFAAEGLAAARVDVWETGEIVYTGSGPVTYISLSQIIYWPGS